MTKILPFITALAACTFLLSGCKDSSSSRSSSAAPPEQNVPLCDGDAITPERLFLQQLGSDRVIIKWRGNRDDDTQEATSVCIGTNPNGLPATSETAAVVTETGHSEAVITGLVPDTTYYYSVGGTGVADPKHTFRTAPVKGALPADGNIRVWIVGDAGTASSPLLDRGDNAGGQAAVRDGYHTWVAANGGEPADLFLMLGDNAYLDGTDEQHQISVFDMYTDTLASVGLWPTIGNHEMGSFGLSQSPLVELYTPVTGVADLPPDSPVPYFNIHTLPTQGETGGVPSGTEQYYSFDYGNVHVISLDSQVSARSEANRTAMLEWVTADLQSSTADWTIVIFHHPPYTKGSHDSDVDAGGVDQPIFDMREQFNPVFEAHGVDLVYGGHSHSYERSYYLSGHTGLSDTFDPAIHTELNSAGDPASGQGAEAYTQITKSGADDKVVYTVAGSSGQATGMTDPAGHPAHFFSTGADLGSVVVDVDTTTLTARFINDKGEVLDHFIITR